MSTASPQLEITCSRQFPEWLAEQQVSLAFSTYQTGKLFLVGLQPNGRLSIFERTFNRCMGLAGDGQTLWMSTLYQVWRLENMAEPGQLVNDGFDRLFVPQVGYTTGDLDIHDIAVTQDGRVLFVNTLFSCLATISETHNFIPLWQPSFITKLAAEDRCHLNGLACGKGVRTLLPDRPGGCFAQKSPDPFFARYVTAVSQSDVADGWRDHRHDGGCVIDVDAGAIIAGGLTMPHSPRLYRDQLWLLNSGAGQFGRVDMARGVFESLAFCPGYLRGMSFVGDFAVIGLSRPRENRTFSGLALDEQLARHGVEARCGLWVIDLRTMDIVHWLRIEGIVAELYDVVVLPGVRRPMLLGFKSDEIRRTISMGTRD